MGRGRVWVTHDIRINPMARVGHTARCPLNIGKEDLLSAAPTGLCIPAQGDALGLRAAHRCVLKERGITVDIRRHRDHRPCGVPSERLKRVARVPRVSPWAGMQSPFGAMTSRQMPPRLCPLPRRPRTEDLPPVSDTYGNQGPPHYRRLTMRSEPAAMAIDIDPKRPIWRRWGAEAARYRRIRT